MKPLSIRSTSVDYVNLRRSGSHRDFLILI
jgi:hypothetical protein